MLSNVKEVKRKIAGKRQVVGQGTKDIVTTKDYISIVFFSIPHQLRFPIIHLYIALHLPHDERPVALTHTPADTRRQITIDKYIIRIRPIGWSRDINIGYKQLRLIDYKL